MLSLLLMLAQVASPPDRPAYPGLFSGEDYPPRAMAKGEEGTVAFEALVSPDGRVDKCTVIVSSRYSDLDAATCKIVQTRARFSPAEDASGKPAYGIFRGVITWSLGSVTNGALEPELELRINQAPPGIKLPDVMTLSYWTKVDGTATNCKLADRSAGQPTVLAELACKSILSQPPEVIRNSKNDAVSASNNMVIRFSLDH